MEESLSLGPATECLLTPFLKVMEKMVGKGHFQGQENGRIKPDAPAAGEPGGAEAHGMRLTADCCLLLRTSHGEKVLRDQYVLKGTCAFNEVVQCADGHIVHCSFPTWPRSLKESCQCGHWVAQGNAQGPGCQPLLLWVFWPGALHCAHSLVSLIETPSC